MFARKLTLFATAATLAVAALPNAAMATDVCNEAENSWQGGYTVAPGVDPNPPAFLRGEQMRLGDGDGAGLENAAEQSPALAVCGDTGGDTGGGDDDGGPIDT